MALIIEDTGAADTRSGSRRSREPLPLQAPRFPWRRLPALAWKESRTARKRLLLYMSSIALGVAALVAIDSFADNLTRSVREQSRSLLGGDASLTTRSGMTPAADSLVDSLGRIGHDDRADRRVPVDGGHHRQRQHATGAGARCDQHVSAVRRRHHRTGGVPSRASGHEHAVLVDPGLLVSLNARIGDSLSLGYSTFVIAGTLKQVPGDAGFVSVVGPRVFVAEQWLDETRLLSFGSRASYETLLKMPPGMQADDVGSTQQAGAREAQAARAHGCGIGGAMSPRRSTRLAAFSGWSASLRCCWVASASHPACTRSSGASRKRSQCFDALARPAVRCC